MQAISPLRWGELQDFLAVAQTGQLARASRLLGVDASTIGRRIRRLEDRVGHHLFDQTREGQTLTEAGERLLVHVEEMQRAAQSIEQAPTSGAALSGLLRVSVAEGFGAWFVARHLRSFCEAYPNIVVELVASNGFLNPSKRETDIAILLARPGSGPVVSRKLSDYTLRLYASNDYLAGAPPIATVDDLLGHQLIGYVPDLLYAPELRYLGEIDPRLVPTVRSSSINAQFGLVAAHAGVGVLPSFIGETDNNLSIVLPQHQITRSFWVVTHEDTRQLKRVAVFHEWLADIVARHRQSLVG
ncbi:LysR family transcriptional regulator [Sphingomonas echinoides]|uniref:LysR family transcriptional regulator n=1 Tax=Sphingomonas echinoides TaxID=59803 RepID=A0ABU4PPM2_9SPHN|nr:LysR family transcriptional regulator [Sphingomonas echinoides]MDX5985077.1 LysR family transcriptional regulator [Sphingomonas echinoides]